MDWLTFITEIAKAIIWPTTVILAVALLRKPLTTLIPGLTHLKWKDFELEFGRKIEELEQRSERLLPETEAPKQVRILQVEGATRQPEIDRFTLLAELSPPAAVLESWLEVEIALKNASARHGVSEMDASQSTSAIRALTKLGTLDSEAKAIINGLRALRNSAAHAPATAITVSQAKDYRSLALRVADRLKAL